MTEEGINERADQEREDEDMNVVFIKSRFASRVAISMAFYRV
jgi:hypothetical protein